MQATSRTSNQSAGTHREYRFRDEHDEPSIIPESWATEAVHEQDDGERFFAVEVRTGRRYEWTVNDSGKILKGPHTDEPAIKTLYVSSDGGRAVVIESKAVQAGPNRIVPREDWASVLVDPDADVAAVTAERRDAYRALIRDLYKEDN